VKFFLILSNLIALIPLCFRNIVNLIVARLFCKYINQIIESKQKYLNIVYDFQTNNPTFGEYILFLILAKYLILKKKKIEIILITNSKKPSFQILSKKKILLYKNELKKLTIFFLKKNIIEYSNFKDFALNYHDKKQTILFSFFVFKRLEIYSYFLQLINLLMSKEKKPFINKMKLTNKNIKISKRLQNIKPYISWHIRKNDKWGNYNNTKDEILKIANYLCPGNIVVSGSRTACERIQVAAVEAGAMKAIPLAVAGAFHTEVMQAAVEPLRHVLENITLNTPRIPVISNVDASVHSDPEIIRQHLVQQVVSPVRWEECMGTLLNQRIDQFYEIGPGRVLRGLLRRIARKTPCENVSC